jgi:N-acetyl-beta-hexosaminidase
MANIGTTFKAVTSSLRRLLSMVAENAALLPDVSVERSALEKELATAEEAKNRQDAHTGDKQLATQDLNAALERAKDAAIQLRNAAKFKLGAKSEKLASFQVAPQRKRGSRKAAQLKKLEAELQKQQADLQKQQEAVKAKEADVLQKQAELLAKKAEAAQAS